MKYLFTLLIIGFISCTNHSFDADMRQIAAKDQVAYKLGRVRGFNVLGFKQDTLINPDDSLKRKFLRYALNITYQDSNNVQQNRTGIVIFTPDGNSIEQTAIAGPVQ